MPLREKAQQFAARDCIQRVNATQKIRAMPNSQPQRVPHGVDFGFGVTLPPENVPHIAL